MSSQSPSSTDDLYLEGRTSGDFPVDDEDSDGDGSGSGSGDYGKETEPALFCNSFACIFLLMRIILVLANIHMEECGFKKYINGGVHKYIGISVEDN